MSRMSSAPRDSDPFGNPALYSGLNTEISTFQVHRWMELIQQQGCINNLHDFVWATHHPTEKWVYMHEAGTDSD